MEVLTLGDLAPILAAVIGPIVAVMFAMMRYQHADSIKTRDLMHKLVEQARQESRELFEKARQESRELIEKNHSELTNSIGELTNSIGELANDLGEVRERLAYVEGYLLQSPPHPPDGDAQAA
ncbi:MAG: hypothetical protein OXF64_03170 [bacterium]|nr:hypothetical protein [bacterium]MCY4192764.1 hypothetical protein [bacterium]